MLTYSIVFKSEVSEPLWFSKPTPNGKERAYRENTLSYKFLSLENLIGILTDELDFPKEKFKDISEIKTVFNNVSDEQATRILKYYNGRFDLFEQIKTDITTKSDRLSNGWYYVLPDYCYNFNSCNDENSSRVISESIDIHAEEIHDNNAAN